MKFLQYAAQFGATDVLLNTPQLPGGERWELYDLVKLRVRVETFGLKLTALENVPTRFYDHIMLNGPKRDEQIENVIVTARNIARTRILIFGYISASSAVADRRAGGRRRRNAEQQHSKPGRRWRVGRRVVETRPALITDRGWPPATTVSAGTRRSAF
jgi:hypothetical protein